MTRFARAKGSKSSNLKAPEDSTPWEVMKEQIIKSKKETEESKLRLEAEQQRIENYNNFLKDQKVQKRKATWCDFPEVNTNKNQDESTNQCSETHIKKKKKNKQKNVGNAQSQLEVDPQLSTNESNISKKHNKKDESNTSSIQKLSNEDENIIEPVKNTMKSVSVNTSEETQNNDKQKNKKKKKNLQQFHNNIDNKKENTELHNNKLNTKSINVEHKNKKLNKKKNKEQRPIRKKEVNDRSFQLIINGKEIELVRFDGFPIMKKDAERLEELKSSMIKKGIPKSEVQRNMKLERRRAEKALARLKREVCYNCRKGGHNLSDCPELKSKIPGVDSAEGVCFKCGSTEHRQFECKVQRDKEFRFATCFICKEAGHIARQCPDNPKGLYPNGGCCKLCGDVTHLKKDCPTTKDKKEESSFKLHTLDGAGNVEDISQKEENVKEVMKKPKKIKF